MKLLYFKHLTTAILYLFLGFGSTVYAQKNDLKQSKSKLLSEIKALNRQIETLNSDKKGTEKRIDLVTQKITFREDLLKVLPKRNSCII